MYRQLGDGPVAPDRRHRHLRLKRCAVLLPCPLHVLLPRYPRFLGAGLHLSHLSHFRGPARNSVARDRITLRTTFRDTRSSRQIVLIGLFCAKYARRIFAIVSTTSIPNLAPASPTEATVDPPSRGSRLDADNPENGVLIPCVFTCDQIERRTIQISCKSIQRVRPVGLPVNTRCGPSCD